MTRTPGVTAVVCLAAAGATAGCGTFRAPEWAPVRKVEIGGSGRLVADGYYADAYRAILDRDYGRALDLLQLARHGSEKDPRVLNAFGVVYDKLGRFDLSARYYAEALAADPQSSIVLRNQAYSLELQRQRATQNESAVAAAGSPPSAAPAFAPPPTRQEPSVLAGAIPAANTPPAAALMAAEAARPGSPPLQAARPAQIAPPSRALPTSASALAPRMQEAPVQVVALATAAPMPPVAPLMAAEATHPAPPPLQAVGSAHIAAPPRPPPGAAAAPAPQTRRATTPALAWDAAAPNAAAMDARPAPASPDAVGPARIAARSRPPVASAAAPGAQAHQAPAVVVARAVPAANKPLVAAEAARAASEPLQSVRAAQTTAASRGASVGPRPYATAFAQLAPPARVQAEPLQPPAASPALQQLASSGGPRSYATAFLDLAGEAAPRTPRPAPATPRRSNFVSMVLTDASGQLDRVLRLRARLTQLGWSAAPAVRAVSPPVARTVIRYPAARARVARALARTLPGGAELRTCADGCNLIQVRFGADIGRWRVTPDAPKKLRKG